MCIIRDAARRSPRVVAKVPRARFSIGLSRFLLRIEKDEEGERKREREGGVLLGKAIVKMANSRTPMTSESSRLETMKITVPADDEVNDVGDRVREE